MFIQFKVLLHALKRNGLLQLVFYLSNLDTFRFIEYSKTMEYLDKEDAQIILDLGAGYSVLPSFIKNYYKQSTYVTLDISLNACRYQANYNVDSMHQILGDMSHLPIRSSTISIDIAISSIEHVGNIKKVDDVLVFDEIFRILKTGGVAIISLPYSYNSSTIVRMVHSQFLLSSLYKLRRLWSIVLGKYLYYFLEQIETDSIMKYYDDNEITNLINKQFSLERQYYFSKKFHGTFFNIVPPGWFILKDLVFGKILSKMDDVLVKNDKFAKGVVFKIRKLPRAYPGLQVQGSNSKPQSMRAQNNLL